MSHTKPMAQALGQVVKSRVKKLGPAKPSDRQVSERTYLALKKMIEDKDRWSQSETRDVLKFKDINGIDWYLTLVNKHAQLRLVLVSGGNGANLGWRSKELIVGWPIEKDMGRIGFALTVSFEDFAKWRKVVQIERPATRPTPKSN